MKLPTISPGKAGAGLVAAVAGYASYRHIFHVARLAGEPFTVAAAYPLATDGLILAATGALFDKRRTGYAVVIARVGLGIGVAATLAYNVLSTRPDLVALPAVRAAVAAWPAVAFLLSIEILTTGRRRLAAPAIEDQADEPEDQADELTERRTRRRWKRGELAGEVGRLVRERAAELPADTTARVARLAELTGGSERQIFRILNRLTESEATA